MSKEKPPSETADSEEEIKNAKKEVARKLFEGMAKVKMYPIDNRPVGTVDGEDDVH